MNSEELLRKIPAQQLVKAFQECILDGITLEEMSYVISNSFPGIKIITDDAEIERLAHENQLKHAAYLIEMFESGRLKR